MGKTPVSQTNNPSSPQPPDKPDFGELLDLDILLALAKVDESDLESAVQWFDENVSAAWQGALGGDEE